MHEERGEEADHEQKRHGALLLEALDPVPLLPVPHERDEHQHAREARRFDALVHALARPVDWEVPVVLRGRVEPKEANELFNFANE